MRKEILLFGGLFLMTALVVGMVSATSTPLLTTASVSVPGFISLSLTSGAPITFGSAAGTYTLVPGTSGTSCNATATNVPLIVSVGNSTNIASVTVQTNANGPSLAGVAPNAIPIINMRWSATGNWGTDLGTAYTQTAANVCTGLNSDGGGAVCNIWHQLYVPQSQKADNYQVGITITGTG